MCAMSLTCFVLVLEHIARPAVSMFLMLKCQDVQQKAQTAFYTEALARLVMLFAWGNMCCWLSVS